MLILVEDKGRAWKGSGMYARCVRGGN